MELSRGIRNRRIAVSEKRLARARRFLLYRPAPNPSLKLTRLSPRLHLGGWAEAVAVEGTSQAKPPRSLAPPVRPLDFAWAILVPMFRGWFQWTNPP